MTFKERERMKLVSEAFDKLGSVVPVYKMMTADQGSVSNQSATANNGGPLSPNQQNSSNHTDLENKNPVTKVSTLRCAISYINSLQRLIEDANQVEIVMNELKKNWNFHFDLQLHPTDLSSTILYRQMIGFIPRRAHIF